MASLSPIASELSYLVLERRRRLCELSTPELDSLNRRLYPLPSSLVVREAFTADRAAIPDSFQGDARLQFDITPTWHYRGRR